MDVSASAPADSASAAEGTPDESSHDQESSSEESEGQPSAPTPRKHRVKVDGQELEVPEEELLKDYELRRASYMRMQQATEKAKTAEQTEKQYKELLTQFKQDPWKLFDALQIDADTEAEKRLLKKLEREMMTPEQKALYEKEQHLSAREREIKEFEELKKQHEEALAKQEQEALTYKAVQEIDNDIGAVLEATGKKPTRRVVSRIAEIMLSHLDSDEDGEHLGAEKALGIFEEEMKGEIEAYLSSIPPEQLPQVLPKFVLDALRKLELDKVRGTNPLKHSGHAERSSTAPATNKKAMSTDSFFENLEKRIR